MFLGKPVVATNWSGNTDFMRPDNSCPVNFRLVRLRTGLRCIPGPGRSGLTGRRARRVADASGDERRASFVPGSRWRAMQTIRDEFSPESRGPAHSRPARVRSERAGRRDSATPVRIAFIVHRYGPEIAGGSEHHCRLVAERLAAQHAVDVLTTCARDSSTGRTRDTREGADRIRGVTVRRFRNSRDAQPRGVRQILRLDLQQRARSTHGNWTGSGSWDRGVPG